MPFLKSLFNVITILITGISFVILFGLFLVSLRSLLPLANSSLTRPVAPAIPPPSLAATPIVATTTTIFYEKEAVISTTTPSVTIEEPAPVAELAMADYIVVTDGCGTAFDGECLNARSGPGTEYQSVAKLRTGTVLKISDTIETASSTWYKVIFDEWLRYPERVQGEWYVAAAHVEKVVSTDTQILKPDHATVTKHIIVDRSEQKLYAYDGEELIFERIISTGIELTPTPRGTFTIYKKTPSRYMQGPLPYLAVSKYYDLAGVPWNMYFTEDGAVIHGAYWHKNFGRPYSSGCVNMSPEDARELYVWADLGTTVTVRD